MKQNDDSENYIGLERLVKKAKAGDQQAKEKLIFAFRPLILTTIQKYVYDQKEYEDAYQDAVCVFLEALRDFELDARVYFQVFIRLRLTNYFKKRREGRFERSVKPEESLDRQIEGEGVSAKREKPAAGPGLREAAAPPEGSFSVFLPAERGSDRAGKGRRCESVHDDPGLPKRF